MENASTRESWERILERFSSYEGTVISFCRENNVSKSQLYYHKKRYKSLNKPSFHAISLNTVKASDGVEKANKVIRIEIGKANIFIRIRQKISAFISKGFFDKLNPVASN